MFQNLRWPLARILGLNALIVSALTAATMSNHAAAFQDDCCFADAPGPTPVIELTDPEVPIYPPAPRVCEMVTPLFQMYDIDVRTHLCEITPPCPEEFTDCSDTTTPCLLWRIEVTRNGNDYPATQGTGEGSFTPFLPGDYIIKLWVCDEPENQIDPCETPYGPYGETGGPLEISFNVPPPRMSVKFDRGKIPLRGSNKKRGKGKASIEFEVGDEVSCQQFWQIIGEDLGAMIDFEGNIRAGNRTGWITVRNTLYDPSEEDSPYGESRIEIVCDEESGCNGGDCGAGNGHIDLKSVDARFDLGRTADGDYLGELALRAKLPSAELYTPAMLEFNVARYDTDVIRDQSGAIESIATPTVRVNVEVDSEHKYYLHYFHCESQGSCAQSPFVSWAVENPDCGTSMNRLRITKIVNNDAKETYEYTYIGSEGSDDWTLDKYVGSTLVRKERVEWDGNSIRDQVVLNPDNTEISRVREQYAEFGNVRVVVSEQIDPNGLNLTTTRDYYATEDARRGKLKYELRADGSWSWFDYEPTEGDGRLIKRYDSLGNTTLPANGNEPDPETARLTTFDYEPIDGGDSVEDEGLEYNPHTIIEKVQDVEIARTYHYFSRSGPLRVYDVKCDRPGIQFHTAVTDSKSLVTINQYKSGEEEIDYIEYAGTVRDMHTSEAGSFDPETRAFTPGAGGYRRNSVTRTEGGYAVPFKSTRRREVTNNTGKLAYSELQTTEDDSAWNVAEWETIEWSQNVYDDNGRVAEVRRSDGTIVESNWGCCDLEQVVDENGVVTDFPSPDGNVRLAIRRGVEASGEYAAQEDITTERTTDALGRLVQTRVMGGDITHVTQTEYDNAGRIASETDSAGLTTTFDYEQPSGTSGRVTTVTRPGGFEEITEYYLDGRVRSVSGDAVVSKHFEYGVESITVDGITFNSTFTLVRTGGAASPRWEKTYFDMLGRKVREERPGYGGSLVRVDYVHGAVYDYSGNVYTKLKMRTSNTLVEQSKGGRGEPSEWVEEAGGTDSWYEYDVLGNLVRTGSDANPDTNPGLQLASKDRITDQDTYYTKIAGNWWQESFTRVYPVTNNAAAVTTAVRRSQLTGLTGQTASAGQSVDVHGNVTTTARTIDRANQIATTTVDTPDSNIDEQSLTRNGLIQSSRSRTGNTLKFKYDAIGRQVGVKDPRHTTTETLDAYSHTHYNALHQVEWTIDADGNQTTYAYESTTGRLASVTYPQSRVAAYTYNARGQVVTVTGNAAQPVEFVYDATFGERTGLKTWRDESGDPDLTKWDYDPATGLVTLKTYAYPSNNEVGYEYYYGGALKNRVWSRTVSSNPIITHYEYDPVLGDLTSIDYSDGTPDVTFEYDRLGRAVNIADALGERTLTYDSSKLYLKNESIDGDLYDLVISRAIQTSGNGVPGRYSQVMVGTTPNSSSLYSSTYGYDAVGRMNSVAGPGLPSGGAVYSFASNSDLTAQTAYWAGGENPVATAERSYEPRRDLVTSMENKWGTTVLSKYAHDYDASARRKHVVRTGTAFAASHFDRYTYNTRSELTESWRGPGADPEAYVAMVEDLYRAYDYDDIGNRQTSQQGIGAYPAGYPNPYLTTYSTNAFNQFTQVSRVIAPPDGVGGDAFQYDLDGNMTQDGDYDYGWDGENRLIAVTPRAIEAGSNRLEFDYDYQSRRIRKRVYTYDGDEWLTTPTVDLRFVYDGWNLLMELDGLNMGGTGVPPVVRKYTWGLDLSGTLQGAGGVGGLLAVYDTAGTTSTSDDASYGCLYDTNGNVGQLVDFADGSLAAKYEYDPYGGPLLDAANASVSGPYAATNLFRFSTKYFDGEVDYSNTTNDGLYYYGYRYYSPRLGRWLSRDPLDVNASLNLYEAMWNALNNHVDPDGREVIGYVAISLITDLSQPTSGPSTQPEFPGKGTKKDPRDISSLWDDLRLSGDPGCGICIRVNPRGLTMELKVRVTRIDPPCKKSAKELENGLKGLVDLAKAAYWVTGFEQKCEKGCECRNKKELPRAYYVLSIKQDSSYLEFTLLPPGPKLDGCTGAIELTGKIHMDGWYGECKECAPTTQRVR